MTASLPSPRLRLRRAERRALWVSGAVTLGLLCLPLLFGEYYYGRDLSFVDGGILCELKARLAAGDGMLVSPMLGNGTPLFAELLTQLFYPLRWLQLLLPLNLASSLGPVIHLAIAAAGACWLALTHRCRPLTAAATGIAFAFTGTCLDLMQHSSNYVVGAAWLPVAWAAGRRVLRGARGWVPRALLVLSLAGCLLGGEPQAFAIAVVIVIIEGMHHGLHGRARGRSVRSLVLCVLAGLALGALAWAPAEAEMVLTRRFQGGLGASNALMWSFDPPEWLAAVFPGILLDPVARVGDLYAVLRGPDADLTWNQTPYVGALVLILAAAGLASRRARAGGVVLALTLIAALGPHTPVLPLAMRAFPPLTLFRFPEKYLVAATLAVVLQAGVGLEMVRRARGRRLFLRLAATWVVVAGIAWVVLGLERHRLDQLGEVSSWTQGLPSLSAVLLEKVGWSLGVVVVALGVMWTRRRGGVALSSLMIADLLLSAPNAVAAGPPLLDVRSPLAAVPPSSSGAPPLFCVDDRTRHLTFEKGNEWGHVFGAMVAGGFTLNACSQVATTTMYTALVTPMEETLEQALTQSHLASAWALGCTHLVTLANTTWDGPTNPVELPRLDRESAVVVRALPDSLPLAFAIRDPRMARDEAELTVNIGHASTLEEATRQVDDPLGRLGSLPLPAGDGATVTSVQWTRRAHAEVVAQGRGGAVVGLRTAFRRGWEAHQAGRSLPVIRVSGANLGAVVEDLGAGPIVFDYRQPLLRLGVASAVAGLAMLILALLIP